MQTELKKNPLMDMPQQFWNDNIKTLPSGKDFEELQVDPIDFTDPNSMEQNVLSVGQCCCC
jgi:hypothetical protein